MLISIAMMVLGGWSSLTLAADGPWPRQLYFHAYVPDMEIDSRVWLMPLEGGRYEVYTSKHGEEPLLRFMGHAVRCRYKDDCESNGLTCETDRLPSGRYYSIDLPRTSGGSYDAFFYLRMPGGGFKRTLFSTYFLWPR